MTDRELMQQALKALSAMLTHMGMDEDDWNKPTFNQCRKAEDALRERLAQPVQEPVGDVLDERGAVDWISFVPPAGTPIFTAPQPRQWQGLTEEEIGVAFRKAFPVGGVVFTTEAVNFYRAIEAKLREKNA